MAKISRDSDVVELTAQPIFEYGQKVKSLKVVRNDGTYAGKDIGEILVRKGEIGYVTSIGTFLQQFYIYGTEFIESGNRVGMRGKELEATTDSVSSAIADPSSDEAASQPADHTGVTA
ncbi:nitrogen fixation protein NifZ [Thiobacillus sp.]|uniref:nitrogen fixation protein NifZ n=1 Tax=Thiobacillus sp. TaxID=924 RepID=UPI00286DCA9A|nr:nitrogen fixation protein NifZ [Thiobacillus sp.]